VTISPQTSPSQPSTPTNNPYSVTVYAYDTGTGDYYMYFEFNNKWYSFGYYDPVDHLIVIGPINKLIETPPVVTSALHQYTVGTYTFYKIGSGTLHISQSFNSQHRVELYREASSCNIQITGVSNIQQAPANV